MSGRPIDGLGKLGAPLFWDESESITRNPGHEATDPPSGFKDVARLTVPV
ncbi:MAG: hypothetical protein MI923_01675 [Phycisphaerales bacterium]|nr:hypothetical protein [Phycisphaerales bacterium]